MESSVLSTNSTKNARQRAARGIHAARSDGYVRDGVGVVVRVVIVASCRAALVGRTPHRRR
jgi:hypothetical protein